jgi:hypothetical protein
MVGMGVLSPGTLALIDFYLYLPDHAIGLARL